MCTAVACWCMLTDLGMHDYGAICSSAEYQAKNGALPANGPAARMTYLQVSTAIGGSYDAAVQESVDQFDQRAVTRIAIRISGSN